MADDKTALDDEVALLRRLASVMLKVEANDIDEITALRAQVASLTARVAALDGALRWYGEQARLCRLIHSEGDAGRHALDLDGGKRALAALALE